MKLVWFILYKAAAVCAKVYACVCLQDYSRAAACLFEKPRTTWMRYLTALLSRLVSLVTTLQTFGWVRPSSNLILYPWTLSASDRIIASTQPRTSPSESFPNTHLINFWIKNVVGIAIRYGLNGLGIEYRWGRDFPHPSRPALGPTQSPIQRVPGLSGG
jgi:hypothetical protein